MGHAWLDLGNEVLRPNLQNVVDQAKVQADAAVNRDCVPLKAASFAVGHHGDTAPVGETQDLYDLRLIIWKNHGVWRTWRMISEGSSVTFDLLPIDVDPAFIRNDVPQRGEQIHPVAPL